MPNAPGRIASSVLPETSCEMKKTGPATTFTKVLPATSTEAASAEMQDSIAHADAHAKAHDWARTKRVLIDIGGHHVALVEQSAACT